jgi:hypothetical protein
MAPCRRPAFGSVWSTWAGQWAPARRRRRAARSARIAFVRDNRSYWLAAAAWLLAATVLGAQAGAPQDKGSAQAAALLQRARQAITGGHAIRSLVLRGTVREGFNGVTGEPGALSGPLEYRILLPDCFLRIARWDISTEERRSGFRGDFVIWTASSQSPAVRPYQTNFAKLVVGLLARTDSVAPLKATGIEGSTIHFKDPGGSDLSLDLDPQSHLPTRARYMTLAGFPTPGVHRNAAGMPIVTPLKYERAEESLVLDDRRAEHGVNLPHRIRRMAKGVTFEDVCLTEIVINPALGRDDFK